MRVSILKECDFAEMKELFLDVFSNDPWFDKWDDENQLNSYIKDLTGNNNSLSLALYDEEDRLVGCSLGYVFNWWEGREYFIREFFVSRERQGQGTGSIFLTLINHILATEGIRHITLTTEKTVPAYQFYQKNGFSVLKDSVYLAKKVPE